MISYKKVGVLSIMLAGSVLMSGCEETEFETREKVISEMIQEHVAIACFNRVTKVRVEMDIEPIEKIIDDANKMCDEVGLLASEAKAKQVAAFGSAGMMVLNNKAYSIMADDFTVVYGARQMDEYNSAWGLTKRFVVWLFERNG